MLYFWVMETTTQIKVLKGDEKNSYIDSISEFRIRYFRDYPYLYAGSLSYEKEYMKGYIEEPRSILVVMVDDNDKLQGVSTGMPLTADSEIVREAAIHFRNAGYDADKIYYFGETILVPEQRGKGHYTKIVRLREKSVKDMGYDQVCFMAVKREKDHPQRPENYQEPGSIFLHMGYHPTQMEVSMNYPTVQPDGTCGESEHQMMYWIKSLYSDGATTPYPDNSPITS